MAPAILSCTPILYFVCLTRNTHHQAFLTIGAINSAPKHFMACMQLNCLASWSFKRMCCCVSWSALYSCCASCSQPSWACPVAVFLLLSCKACCCLYLLSAEKLFTERQDCHLRHHSQISEGKHDDIIGQTLIGSWCLMSNQCSTCWWKVSKIAIQEKLLSLHFVYSVRWLSKCGVLLHDKVACFLASTAAFWWEAYNVKMLVYIDLGAW